MYERFIAEHNQRDFILTQRYLPNTNSIQVYVNGLLLNSEDYEESNDHRIRLKDKLQKEDIVQVAHLKDIRPGIRLGTGDIVGNKKTSMFFKYDGLEHLRSNTRYDITLSFCGKTFTSFFTSSYSPFYCKINDIKVDLGRALDYIDDEVINNFIWQRSIDVETLVENKGAIDLKDKKGKVHRAVEQWVRYGADLDCLNHAYISIATNSGSVDKMLGEMRITKTISLPYLDDLLDRYQKKYDDAEDIIAGHLVRGYNMVKAGKTAYPINSRRTF